LLVLLRSLLNTNGLSLSRQVLWSRRRQH